MPQFVQFALDESLKGTYAILLAAGLGDPMSRPVIMVTSSRVGSWDCGQRRNSSGHQTKNSRWFSEDFHLCQESDNDKLSASAMFNSCHKGI